MKRTLLVLLLGLSATVWIWGQSITVTSPAAGDVWFRGGMYTIAWSKSGQMHDRVKIRLFNSTGTTKILDINDDTANDGKFLWTIPMSVTPGIYVIRVKTLDNAVSDDSEVFSIAAWTGLITITNPISSSDWCHGNTYKIQWTKSGVMHNQVMIDLFTWGMQFQITPATANDQSFDWTVPNSIPIGTYYISIKTLDNRYSDNSDWFTICGPAPQAQSTVTVPQPKPDLVVCFDDPQRVLLNKHKFKSGIYVTVKNIGNATAGPSKLKVIIENRKDALFEIPALDPNKRVMIKRESVWYSKGSRKFRAVADYGNQVVESDENNNAQDGKFYKVYKYVTYNPVFKCSGGN